MALSKKQRAALPKKDFAGPGRSFPVENKAHARAAELDARKDKNITPAERKTIDRKADRVLRGKSPSGGKRK